MAAIKFIKRTVAMDGGPITEQLPASFFTGEYSAHTFIIAATRGNNPLMLSGTVTASFVNANDEMVPITACSVVDGAAVVTLSDGCYHVKGRFTLTIYVNGGAVYDCASRIQLRSTNSAYDPSHVIPNLGEIQAEVAAMRAATAAAAPAADAADNVDIDLTTGTDEATITITRSNGTTKSQTIRAVVGDDYNALKSALAAETRNLFDKTTITIGLNAAGAPAVKSRALSGAMKVSGTAVYFAKTLPTNIKYEIERYSGAEASTFTGSVSGGWNTTTTWRQYTNREQYIRVLFGTIDNAAFSVHDFDELELCVLDTPILSDYIPHLTATDYLARETIKAIGSDVSEIAELSRNLFAKEEVQIGVGESGTPSLYKAISGAMHIGNLNSAVRAYNIAGLQYNVAFYNSEDLSDYAAIRGGGSFIADTLTHLQTQADYPYPYARIVLRRSDGAKINQLDLDNLVLQFETGNGSSDYIPYHTAHDYIARKDCETLTVCTWNVGLWNNGVTPYMNLADLYKWYRLIGKADADLLLTQESPIQLDENNELSYNSFLSALYPYVVSPRTGESNYTAKGVASKMNQSTQTRNFFEDGVRTYLKSYITVGGKLVCLINVHLDSDQTKRTAEIGEMLGVLNTEERVIVCGDFNVTDFSEYDGFTFAGYRLANHGIFGDFVTCPNAAPIKAIDNIIVSNNIRITNVRTVDGAGADGLSDHNPLLATLEI